MALALAASMFATRSAPRFAPPYFILTALMLVLHLGCAADFGGEDEAVEEEGFSETTDLAALAADQSGFVPMRAYRRFDSRHTSALSAGQTRCFAIAGGNGVPDNAFAVFANITAVSPTAAGFLTVFPRGSARPETSTLNYAAGQRRANGPFREFDSRDGAALAKNSTTCLKLTGSNGVPASTWLPKCAMTATARQLRRKCGWAIFESSVASTYEARRCLGALERAHDRRCSTVVGC